MSALYTLVHSRARGVFRLHYKLTLSGRCTLHIKALTSRRSVGTRTKCVWEICFVRWFCHSRLRNAFFALAPVAWRARALAQLAEGAHETDPRHRQQSFRPAVPGHRRAQCTWVSAACLPLELTACPPEPSHASLPAPSASSVSSARPPPHAPTAHSASLSTCRQATMDVNEHANCVEDPGRCVWAA